MAIAYASFFSLIKNKFIKAALPIFLCIILIKLTNKEAELIVKYVSIPDKLGYEKLLSEAKKADKNTIFFVESVDDPNYKNHVLGAVPQMALPPLFGFEGGF